MNDLLLWGWRWEAGLTLEGGIACCCKCIYLRGGQKCGIFVTPCLKLEFAAAKCSYLRMFEEGGDASDVQAQASRSASRSVNAAGEERVVLLPRAHAPRAR